MLDADLEKAWECAIAHMLRRTEALLRPAECPSLFDLRSIPVAAAQLGIHPKSLYRMVAQGRVQVYGSRGFLKVSLAELLKPVEKKRVLKNRTSGGSAPGARKLA